MKPVIPSAGRVRILFWRGRVLYLGPIDDLEAHAHHAVQAAVSPSVSPTEESFA
jgi:hypothetical protein